MNSTYLKALAYLHAVDEKEVSSSEWDKVCRAKELLESGVRNEEEIIMAKLIERGWGGHFICADRCLFRRNTLIDGDNKKIVVSTVGGMRNTDNTGINTIGANGRYYETMAFKAHKDGEYWEADVSKELSFDSQWSICANSIDELPDDVDNKANDMHNAVVAELAQAI